MNILLPAVQDFKIIKIPPYRAKLLTQEKISPTDQIAFMAQFYPPPAFLKLTFKKELQTSASSSSASQKTQKDQQQQIDDVQCSQESQSLNDERQYEMSEIKPSNKEYVTHSRKFKEKNKKEFEGSQLEYRQLLDDLSFQKNIHMSDSSSQNLQKQDFHFQLSQDEHSYIQSGKKGMNYQNENQQINTQQRNKKFQEKSLFDLKWDSPQEISFRKQNKIKRIFRILNKKLQKIYEESINNIKKSQNTDKNNCQKKNNTKVQSDQNNSKKQKSGKIQKSKMATC